MQKYNPKKLLGIKYYLTKVHHQFFCLFPISKMCIYRPNMLITKCDLLPFLPYPFLLFLRSSRKEKRVAQKVVLCVMSKNMVDTNKILSDKSSPIFFFSSSVGFSSKKCVFPNNMFNHKMRHLHCPSSFSHTIFQRQQKRKKYRTKSGIL